MDIGASSSSGRQAATQRIQLSDISSNQEHVSDNELKIVP